MLAASCGVRASKKVLAKQTNRLIPKKHSRRDDGCLHLKVTKTNNKTLLSW